MKRTLQISLLLFLSFFEIHAQSYTLTRSLPVAEIPTPSTGVTAITTLGDDNSSALQNIGFSFSIYGISYTNFYVGSNGLLSFGTGQSGSYGSALPNSQNFNSITFAGGDLDCRASASPAAVINSFTTGTSPNRILVLNFKNIRTYNTNPNFSNVQVQLYEGTSNIELHITNVQSIPGSIQRTIGICDNVGSNFATQTSINGVTNLNVVNEMIRFNYVAPCPNTITLSSSAPNICPGSTAVLTATASNSAGLQYEWYKSGTLISGTTSNSITLSTKEDYGSYFVKIKDPVSGCTRSTTAQFIGSTFLNNIFLNVSSNNLCLDTPINFLASSNFSGSGVTYAWSGPNSFSSTANSPTVIMSASAEGLYTLSATLAGCGTGTYSRYFKAITPVVTASSSIGSSSICESGTGSVTLFANLNGSNSTNPTSPTTATYAWTGPDGFSSTTRNPVISPLTVSKSGTYTLTVTLSGGCSEVITKKLGLKIVSSPEPNINYSPITGSYCTNDSISLNMYNNTSIGTTGVSYLWTMPDGTTSTLSQPRVKINEGGTFLLTSTFTGGCTGSYTKSITIYPSSSPGIGYPNQSTCVGQNYTFSSYSYPAAFSYNWTGPGGFTATGQTPVINNVSAANAGNYVVVVTSPNCPNTSSATVPLSVAATCPVPVTCNSSIITGNYNGTFRCPSSNTYIRAFISNPTPGTTYSWSGPNGFTANTPEILFNNLQVVSYGIYTCTVTVPFGNCAGTQILTYNLTAFPNNDIKINPVNSITVCEGTNVGNNISSNQSNFEFVEVTGPNGFYASQNTTSSSYFSSISNSITPAQSGTYTVNATLKPSCPTTPNETIAVTTSYTVTVVVRPPTPVITASPASITAGQSSTLSNTNTCSGTLYWQLNSGAGTTKIVTPTTTTSYWAYCNVSTSTIGCSSLGSTRVTVTVNTPCPTNLLLVSTADDYVTGTTTKQANATTGNIMATNKITGSANVTYQAGKSITLNPGFSVNSGTVFKTQFGGCN